MTQSASPLRVLYADHWTLGLHNFQMYDPFLKQRGCATSLFHIGSYRGEPVSMTSIDEIECRDIRSYPGGSLGAVLDAERPDVIVALNHFELFERALFKAARNRGIPTVYVMHGIRLEDLESYRQFYGSNTGWGRRLRKVPKYLDLLRMYASAHMEKDRLYMLRQDLYKLCWRYVSNPLKEIFQPDTTPDTDPDLFLLYGESDRRLYANTYCFPAHKIAIVGNTKLDGLFNRIEEFRRAEHRGMLLKSIGLDPADKYVLNIEDAMVEMNPKSFPHELQAEWYLYMEKAVEAASYRFVVKVHPGTNFDRFASIFPSSSRTKVVQKADLDGLLYHSEAVIGTISTALINAAALEKVILACEWLNIDMLKMENFYVKHGAAISCATENEFEQALRDLSVCESRLKMSRANMLDLVLTYRDGKARERVADSIVRIAGEFRDKRSRQIA